MSDRAAPARCAYGWRQRRYGADEVRRLNFIWHARVGVRCRAIGQLLDMAQDPTVPAGAHQITRARLDDVNGKIERLTTYCVSDEKQQEAVQN